MKERIKLIRDKDLEVLETRVNDFIDSLPLAIIDAKLESLILPNGKISYTVMIIYNLRRLG